MTPKITFKEKAGKLLLKISIYGRNSGLYDTGITIDRSKFNDYQQISGEVEIQKWMTDVTNELLKQFRPDMTPKRLWMSFLDNQSETSATIRDAFNYYLANMPLRDNSKSVYISIGRVIERAGLYDTSLMDVTPALLRSFMNGLTTSPGSKFNTFVRIKAAITRYLKDHRINLALDFDNIVKKPRYTMKENQWLTLEEVRALLYLDLKWVKAEARDLFVLCCYTGMSISDALKFSKRNIQVIGDREFVVYNRIKTGSQCKVPIFAEAKKIIEGREWPVKIKRRAYMYQVARLGEAIGRELNTHKARKTFGALCLEFKLSIEATSYFLGHASIAVTQRHYTTITQKKIENEINSIALSGLAVF